MTANEEAQNYIEEMGIVMEGFGLPRMWGRVFGALLLADPPEQTADQLAQALQASRGSISTATRMLEQAGLIERLSKPGHRKDYFRNKPGAWQEINRRRMDGISALAELAERGLALVPSNDPEVRRGLEEMLHYMRFFEREYPKLLERWEAEYADEQLVK